MKELKTFNKSLDDSNKLGTQMVKKMKKHSMTCLDNSRQSGKKASLKVSKMSWKQAKQLRMVLHTICQQALPNDHIFPTRVSAPNKFPEQLQKKALVIIVVSSTWRLICVKLSQRISMLQRKQFW